MTKLELRELVKSHFSLVDATEHTFAQAELLDGTVVKTDAEGGFEVGQKAMVVTEEGDAPAPMGEHELTDGTILVIDEEGTITGVKTKDEEGQGSLEGDTATEMEDVKPEEAVQMAEEEIAEDVVETAIEEGMTPDDVLEAVKTVIEEVVQPQIEELKKEVMAYKEKMEKISNEPATESKTATTKFAKTTLTNNEGPAHNKSRYEMALQTLTNKRKK